MAVPYRHNCASRWTVLDITAHFLCNSHCNILDENSITADRSAEHGKRHNVHCPSIHCHNTDPTPLRATLTQITSHKTQLPFHVRGVMRQKHLVKYSNDTIAQTATC